MKTNFAQRSRSILSRDVVHMHPLLAARQTVAELFNAAPLEDGDHVGYLNWSHDLVNAIQSAASHGASESEVEGYVDHSFDLVYPYLPLDVEDWPDWSKPAFVQARLRMLKQREADMLQASISRASQPSKSAAAENTHTQPNVQPVASTSSEGAFAAGPSHPSSWLAEADLTDSSRPSHKTNISETPQDPESVAPPPTSLMDEQSLKRKHEDTGVSQRQDKRAKPVSIACDRCRRARDLCFLTVNARNCAKCKREKQKCCKGKVLYSNWYDRMGFGRCDDPLAIPEVDVPTPLSDVLSTGFFEGGIPEPGPDPSSEQVISPALAYLRRGVKEASTEPTPDSLHSSPLLEIDPPYHDRSLKVEDVKGPPLDRSSTPLTEFDSASRASRSTAVPPQIPADLSLAPLENTPQRLHAIQQERAALQNRVDVLTDMIDWLRQKESALLAVAGPEDTTGTVSH